MLSPLYEGIRGMALVLFFSQFGSLDLFVSFLLLPKHFSSLSWRLWMWCVCLMRQPSSSLRSCGLCKCLRTGLSFLSPREGKLPRPRLQAVSEDSPFFGHFPSRCLTWGRAGLGKPPWMSRMWYRAWGLGKAELATLADHLGPRARRNHHSPGYTQTRGVNSGWAMGHQLLIWTEFSHLSSSGEG